MRTVKIPDLDGTEYEAPAWPTPVPGLVIARVETESGKETFAVTHERSGLGLLWSASPENAMRMAVLLGEDLDWTLAAAEIHRLPHYFVRQREVEHLADVEHSGRGVSNGPWLNR